MKDRILILLLQVCLFMACLNPPHDNVFDPLNPDKGHLSGKTCTVDSTPLPGALLKLVRQGNVTASLTSGSGGLFSFSDVDPGIYTVTAEAAYHSPVEFFPESLSAGCRSVLDIYFSEMKYDFEIDPAGTAFIPGWNVQAGTWQVAVDSSDMPLHTVPHVFQGTISGAGACCCLTDREFGDLFFSVRMKSEIGNPSMGIYFRYVDTNNFYRVLIDPRGTSTVAVNKMAGGTSTDLSVQNPTVDKNVWYTLTLECRGSDFTYRITGGSLNSGTTLSDSAFPRGKMGILVIPNGTVHFDDIIIRPD